MPELIVYLADNPDSVLLFLVLGGVYLVWRRVGGVERRLDGHEDTCQKRYEEDQRTKVRILTRLDHIERDLDIGRSRIHELKTRK